MSAPSDLLDTGRLLPPLRFSIAHSGSGSSEHGPLCSEMTAELEQRCSEGAAMSSMELEPTCSEWDATNSFEELEPTCSERQARRSFAELCRALQGRWVEVGGKRKRWTVDGHNATAVVERGRCPNPVVLTRSADGGLNWGNGNMFYLDRQFDRSSGRAIWRRHPGGTEAFVWKALDNTSMELEPTCSEWEATNSFEELEPTCSERQARSSFAELCQALQGRWVEVGGKRKRWTVDGHNATPVVERGRCPYPVGLTRSADGGLNWGNGNMFYLDRQFDRCSGRAIWRRHPDGTEAFVWKALDNADELPGLLGPPDERRLDPDRQEAYSWDEMCAVYAGVYSTLETAEYWKACKVVSQGGAPNSKVSVLRHVDRATGKSCTWEEMLNMYSGEYEPSDVAVYWVSCPEVPFKNDRAGPAIVGGYRVPAVMLSRAQEDVAGPASVGGAGTHPASMSSRAREDAAGPTSVRGYWMPGAASMPSRAREDVARSASVGGASTHPASMLSRTREDVVGPARAPGYWLPTGMLTEPREDVARSASVGGAGTHPASMLSRTCEDVVGPASVPGYWLPTGMLTEPREDVARSASVGGAGTHLAGMSSRASFCGAGTRPASMPSRVARKGSAWCTIDTDTRERFPLEIWPALH